MPAARISSGPSASKRRCSLPPAISSAQAASASGRQLVRGRVDEVAAAVRPGRGDVRGRRRLGGLRRRPGPQRTSRSISPRCSSSVFQRPFSYGPRTVPSTIARPCSSGGEAVRPRRPRRRSSRRRRGRARPRVAAAVRRRSASSSPLPTPTAPTRAATRRPSAWRRVTRPSSPRSSPASIRWARRPSTSRSSPSAAPESARGRERRRRGRRPRPPRAAPRRRRSA